MAPKHYQKPPQAPPSFKATPESLIADSLKLTSQKKSIMDKIVRDVKPETASFENTVLPMAIDENYSGLSAGIIKFYRHVSTNKGLRDASIEAKKRIDECRIEAYMRQDMYQLVEAVFQKGRKLDPESQRFLEKERKGYIRNGLGIPAGPKQDRFKEIKERISQITADFQRVLNEENGGIWLKKEELEGVPEDVLDGLENGIGENEGMIKLSFKDQDLLPALDFALNGELRKRLFIENENKCNANIPFFRETIILRDEAARLLGYPDHASFIIEKRMAKTPKTVTDFLGYLRTQLISRGIQEADHLKELKKQDLKSRGLEASFDGNYYQWDHRFYYRLMLKNEYSVDKQEIAEYFPLQSTIKGILRMFEELFGLVFVQIDGEERDKISETGKGNDVVWHEDAKLFTVWDDERHGGAFSGYLYLDLHARPGKYSHAAKFTLQPGFLFPNGTRQYPATALVCNFSKPTTKKPSLLKHREIVTLFHELGHGIHDLVGRTIYSRFHGCRVARDFVEAPSQMLEYWCWIPSQLKSLSNHYETGEKITDDLIEKLIKTKYVNGALSILRRLHLYTFDMDIHTPKSHEAVKALKISELYNDMRTQISGIKGLEALGALSNWGNGYTTFSHIMNGYDAGLYSYLYSQVYSADIFHTAFAKDPMNAEEGRRYRHMVLEKGGSQDEMKTLEDFLGRKPSTEAFYRELKLKPAK